MQYKNKVEICGIDTSSLKVLKEDKKLELIKKAHNGDKDARDEICLLYTSPSPRD